MQDSLSETQPLRNQPTRFVDHMQQLFGEDPDPLFLEESWSVGVPAAIENLHRRRSHRASHSSADRAIRELERIAALTDSTSTVESFLADRSQPIDSRYLPASLQRNTEPRSSTHQPQNPSPCIDTASASQLLGVSATATRAEIRSAYRSRVIQCHPDRFSDAGDAICRNANQRLSDLNQAYRLLCEDRLNQAA